MTIGQAPLPVAQTGSPSSPNSHSTRHLWVFSGAPDSLTILELAQISPSLQSGKVKHSNLTGGADASCGGELWVDSTNASQLYVNGCSGRYGPQDPAELNAACAVFSQQGFVVKNFGWDTDTDRPARIWRG
jgi:hypothetical protein